MKIYIGYDPRDELAFRACVSSLQRNASRPLQIYPLREYELRRAGIYHRPYMTAANGQLIDGMDSKPFSTQFSFTRFLVPFIAKRRGDELAMFCDADFLFRKDIDELSHIAQNSDKALFCVQHDYRPAETTKFDGMQQQHYSRKNWSSLMIMKPALLNLDPHKVSTMPGAWLHALAWVDDAAIGELPPEWNCLEGSGDILAEERAAALHYTRGTPDMLGDKLTLSREWWLATHQWHPLMNHHEIGLI